MPHKPTVVLTPIIVYGYQLFNVILSYLLLSPFNTHIRVMPVTLIWVLGHTLVWVSSNCLYMVHHRLVVLMLYILLSITVVVRSLRTTFVVLFIQITPDLEYYPHYLICLNWQSYGWNVTIKNFRSIYNNFYGIKTFMGMR